jgi:acyl carrier protein
MGKNLMVSDELKKFLNRQIGKSWWMKEDISTITRLKEDLKIDGDDAVDFFTAFEKEFNVDISNFNIGEYFNGEGFDPIGISRIINFFTERKETFVGRTSKSINLGHLLKSIEEGRLDESVING